MAQLADKFPNLEHLTLENFDVNFPELGEFKTLQSLRLISRWKVEVCNEFYRSVARRIENLQKLQLISVRVRGDQVHHFLAISQLRALDCDNWPAQSVEQLGQLTDLECLALDCIGSPSNAGRQLLSLIKNCYKLNHLKLGKHWQMPVNDVNTFLTKVPDLRSDPKSKLLLTFDFISIPDTQEKVLPLYIQLGYSIILKAFSWKIFSGIMSICESPLKVQLATIVSPTPTPNAIPSLTNVILPKNSPRSGTLLWQQLVLESNRCSQFPSPQTHLVFLRNHKHPCHRQTISVSP